MRSTGRFPCCAVLVVLLLVVSSGYAQNNRSAVSITGSDLASCTVPDPCRTFDVALGKTNSGGEVIVLSSGGYGPFTVTKSVSVISPPAIHAAMAPAAGTAITVNAPDATVILKGLYLNSLGALTGVSINSETVVHIENLVVNGFESAGIEIMVGEVFVKDSEIRNGSFFGIIASPTSGGVILTVDKTRLSRNSIGLVADSGVRVTVRDTVARNSGDNFNLRNAGALTALLATIENSLAADGSTGFRVQDGARVTIRNSAAVRNSGGFVVSAAAGTATELYLDHCLAAENTGNGVGVGGTAGTTVGTVSNSTVVRNFTGIFAGSNGTVRIFGNTVTNNGTGLSNNNLMESAGHNMVRGNTTETFGTISPISTM